MQATRLTLIERYFRRWHKEYIIAPSGFTGVCLTCCSGFSAYRIK